jgi:hypothetical protein
MVPIIMDIECSDSDTVLPFECDPFGRTDGRTDSIRTTFIPTCSSCAAHTLSSLRSRTYQFGARRFLHIRVDTLEVLHLER